MTMSEDKKIFREFTFREIALIVAVVISLGLVLVKINSFFMENILAGEKQTVAAIKVGIGNYFIESATKGRSPLSPVLLDGAPNNFASEKNPFFTNILAYPGVTSKWRKLLPTVYQGPGESLYFYNPVSGDFSEKMILSEKLMRLLGISSKKITGDLVNQLLTQSVIIFSDGKKLAGGALVLVPRLNGKFSLKGQEVNAETFSNLGGDLQAEKISELSAPGLKVKFGYYTTGPAKAEKTLYEIFNGSEHPGAVKSFSIAPGESVGFYSSITNDAANTYYSEKDINPDKIKHFCIYRNDVLRKIIVACKVTVDGRNRDYQDTLVMISY